jgi:trimethylamine--corrinoid protein Co-methyltransferase
VFQLVKKIGPGGHFLGETHTLESNLFIFQSQHNNSLEQWEVDGKLDSEQVGIKKAKSWLEKYQLPAMDPALDEVLLAYIERRTAEIGMS